MAELYRVVDQQWSTRVTPAGRFEETVTVTIETQSGIQVPLEMPSAAYSAETVKTLAEATAAEVERTQAL